jgi:hypothetical protein
MENARITQQAPAFSAAAAPVLQLFVYLLLQLHHASASLARVHLASQVKRQEVSPPVAPPELATDAWSKLVIPLIPDTSTAEQWMRLEHPNVLQCAGWNVDKNAQCVPMPGSNLVILARGSYGVCNVATCPTTRNIQAWSQSAALCAGYPPPGLVFSDMLPMFCHHPADFEAAGGCAVYTQNASKKTAGYADVLQAAHGNEVVVKAALETVGLKILPVTLSPDVNSCYKRIGLEDSRCLPYESLPTPLVLAGIISSSMAALSNFS